MVTKIPLTDGAEFIIGDVLAHNSVFKTWSVEHYSKCSFRCAYCCFDSQGKSVPTVDPDRLIAALEKDIRSAATTGSFIPKQTSVILSCHTDPYINEENSFLLTRHIINYLISINQPFIIGTRGVLIRRDFDLLKHYADSCAVHFSLPVIHADYLKKFEPHVPAIEERISAIWAAHDAGINITVRIDPWIPGATDVEAILDCLPENIDVLVSPLILSDVYQVNGHNNELGSDKLAGPDNRNDLLFNKYQTFIQRGFCQTATRLFSNLSQSDINREYISARNRIGFRRKVKWYYPPMPGANLQDLARRFLKPGELSSLP